MSSESCAECGRFHCEKCSECYAALSAFVRIDRYWEAADGVSHIVAVGDNKPRVLCSSEIVAP